MTEVHLFVHTKNVPRAFIVRKSVRFVIYPKGIQFWFLLVTSHRERICWRQISNLSGPLPGLTFRLRFHKIFFGNFENGVRNSALTNFYETLQIHSSVKSERASDMIQFRTKVCHVVKSCRSRYCKSPLNYGIVVVNRCFP